MRTENRTISGGAVKTITAEEGKVFRRKHDGLVMGSRISLGFEYSTGEKREDKAKYYEEIDEPEE